MDGYQPSCTGAHREHQQPPPPDSTGPVANGRTCNAYRVRCHELVGTGKVHEGYIRSLERILEYPRQGLTIEEIRPCRIDLCSKALVVKDVLRAAAGSIEAESRQQEIDRLESRLNELTSNQGEPIQTNTPTNEQEQQHYE